ncbi:vacuolar protein sorting-associated protein 45 [Blastocladiella emersonii ATCC 22665]|nr:vacuolar protein sorting-associated protein 45 [Blastocladiella emersonii ATCC 22665]
MNVIQAAQAYVTKMIADPAGMKVLLLDADTTAVVSSVYTQSVLLSKEVYLVERVENKKRDKMSHLKCIVFVRPTVESLNHVMDELRAPKYGDYYLYFSNVLKKLQVEKLAEADEFEVVREVQEYFADYLAVNQDLFSLDMEPPAWPLYAGTLNDWDPRALQRTVEGLASVALALKRRPVVRYTGASAHAKRLAHELAFHVSSEPALFDARGMTPAVFLLVDRRADPVTPLLTQWTYQAMVHELIGIHRGLVDLSHVDDVREDLRQVVLSAHDDAFFAANMSANFGDLGFAIKHYLDEYQQRTASHATLESIADMKKFVDAYPEVRKLAGNVSKHVALTSELSRVVDAYRLLAVSEVEQNIACDPRDQTDAVWACLRDPLVPDECKLKLVLLFTLKNPRAPAVQGMAAHLAAECASLSPGQCKLVEYVTKYALNDTPAAGHHHGSSSTSSAASAGNPAEFLDRTRQLGKSVFRGLKGVENVYTQHTPKLHTTLEQLVRGKLREAGFPYPDGTSGAQFGFHDGARVSDVVVFVIGGATFEEARFVSQLAAATPGLRIVLGGHSVLNSQGFLKQVHDTFTSRVAG